MTDVVTREKRSWMMSRVKGRDTKPEILIRSMVHRMGFRFRVCQRHLPGSPDIVLPRHLKVVFVHGCFWHGHESCTRSKRPKTNTEFWNKKLDGNIERDKRVRERLYRMGWRVLVIWQCETRKPEQILGKLENFLHVR